MYSQNVTHAQLVATAVDMLGDLSDYFTYSEYYFPDVTDIDEKNKIQLAVDLGLIQREWLFEPESTINIGDATRLIIKIMGYEEMAEDKGGDVLGYAAVARNIGLHDGLGAVNIGETLVWSDFLHILYNAIDINIMKLYGYTSEGVRYTAVDSTTILNEYFKIFSVKGVVNANEHSAIDHGSSLNEGEIRVGSDMIRAGNTDADDMLGYYIYGFAAKSGNTYTLLTYMTEGYNKEWKINADDLMPSHSDWSAYRIVYEDEKGRTKQIALPSDVAVVYNGKGLFDFTEDDLDIELGDLTVVDNDLDGLPDAVVIHEYENYIVDSVNAEDETVYVKGNGKSPLVLDSSVDAKLLSVNGDEYLISELSEYAVLSLEISKDGELIRGVVSKDKRSGIINQYRVKDGKNYIYLDGVMIGVCKSWYDLETDNKCDINTDSVGGRYVVYLDKNGEAAFFIEKKSGEMYAFLYGINVDGGFEKITTVRVFTEDGTWNEYTASDKTEVFDTTDNTIKTVKSGEVGTNSNYGLIPTDSRKAKEQMVKLEVNDDNELVRICPTVKRADLSTSLASDVEDKLCILEESNKNYAYRSTGNVLGTDYTLAVDSSTKIFSTPRVDDISDGEYDYDYFEASGIGMLRNDFTHNNLDIYDKSDMNVVGMIVRRQGTRTNDLCTTGAYLVKSVMTERDDDGEYISLECINNNKEVTVRAIYDDVLKNITAKKTDGSTYTADVAAGDILSCHLNTNGLIDEAVILYDSSLYADSTKIPGAKITNKMGGRDNEANVYYGEVLKKDNGYLLVECENGTKRVFNTAGTSYIYSVDMSEKSGNKAFKLITNGEIPVGGKVMVHTRVNTIMQAIVYFAD